MAEESSAKPKKTNKQRLLEAVTSLSPDDGEREAASKKISWILRHGIRKVNLKPDNDGYIKVDELLKVELLDDVAPDRLMQIITESNQQKLRYDIKDGTDGKLIKALSKEARDAKKKEGIEPRPAVAAVTSAKDEKGMTVLRGEAEPFVPSTSMGFLSGSPYGYGYPYGMVAPTPNAYAYGMSPLGAMQKGGATKYRGRIKSFNSEKGFGFIECPQAYALFNRDVFVHKSNVGDMAVGTEVTFGVETNKQGMPQARDIVTVSASAGPTGKSGKGKGKDGKGKGDTKEKGKGKGRGGKGKNKKEEDKKDETPSEEKKDAEEKKETS